MRGRIAILAGTAALLLLLPGAALAGPPDGANMNAGTIDLECDGTTVTIWVNFVGSERSGESPSLVVTDTGARVFKVTSFSIEGDPDSPYSLRFPAPDQPFEPVVCTHDDVSLVGTFIP